MKCNVDLLFPTPVLVTNILSSSIDLTVVSDLIKNIGGKNNERTTFTGDKLQDNDALKELTKVIDQAAEIYCNEVAFINFKDLKMTSMWGITHTGYSAHQYHSHPNSFLSGVLYLEVPSKLKNIDKGPLKFKDPRPGRFGSIPSTSTKNLITATIQEYVPVEGNLLIFPSFLEHGIDPMNLNNHKRVCIAFNYSLLRSNEPTVSFDFSK